MTFGDYIEYMNKNHVCDCGHRVFQHNMTCDIDRLGEKGNPHPCHYCLCEEYKENGKVFND